MEIEYYAGNRVIDTAKNWASMINCGAGNFHSGRQTPSVLDENSFTVLHNSKFVSLRIPCFFVVLPLA